MFCIYNLGDKMLGFGFKSIDYVLLCAQAALLRMEKAIFFFSQTLHKVIMEQINLRVK